MLSEMKYKETSFTTDWDMAFYRGADSQDVALNTGWQSLSLKTAASVCSLPR